MSTVLKEQPSVDRNRGAAIVEGSPPLEPGDRLTREEFYRRWDAMPELKRAERIEGVVYMAAATRFRQHGNPHSLFTGWLAVYDAETPGVESGVAATVQLDEDNDVQPDGLLRIAEGLGGQSRITGDGYLAGAPELLGEIAASSASYDLHDKLHVYRRSGVREYIVWKVLEKEIVWYRLHEGNFTPIEQDDNGIYRSRVFPGLWLDAPTMLAGDMKKVLAVLREGLNADEHAEFVNRLGMVDGMKDEE